MKKITFLTTTTLNDIEYQLGEERLFTPVFNANTNAKNKHYLPGDLISNLLGRGVIAIFDEDAWLVKRHNITAAYHNALETLSENYKLGLCSDTELLLGTISAATNSLSGLNALETQMKYEQDQISMKVARTREELRNPKGKEKT